MKFTTEYGPQLDPTDGTIGNLKLVKRYAIARDGMMCFAQQGRYTYATRKEAEVYLSQVQSANTIDIWDGMEVKAFWCHPNHFDPVGGALDE